MKEPCLELKAVQKDYEGTSLLAGIDLMLQEQETLCLLGPSGSGKSTLLRILAGLENADAGSILWKGKDITALPVEKRNFGLMFQDYALFPHKNVAENVAFGLRMQKLNPSEIERRVRDALEQVNLVSFSQRRVTDLSGGEQQRVALARALAPRPRLLMLDEPLGALDRALKEEMEEEIRLLLHATGIPAIYVTHDQEEAFAIADRLILLNHGKVEHSGTPADVYTRPVTTWTARFLGFSNLLPGTVVSQSPLRAETSLGIFQGVWVGSGSPRNGESVTLLLRPTALRAAPKEPGLNELICTVYDSVFRGSGYRVIVRCANGQQFSFMVPDSYAEGKEFRFGVNEEEVQFLQENNG